MAMMALEELDLSSNKIAVVHEVVLGCAFRNLAPIVSPRAGVLCLDSLF